MYQNRILIVEDEAIVALSLKKKLENAGFVVVDTVASGPEAIKRSFETRPDLILMDISLEGEMDGVETAEKIQKHLDVPVIYLTAYANDETLQRVKKTSIYGYCSKPVTEWELYSNIELALYKYRIETELRLSEEKYRFLAENSNDIIFQVDRGGRVIYCSNAVKKILGFNSEDIIGKNIAKFIYYGLKEPIPYIDSLINDEEDLAFIASARTIDDRTRYLEINSRVARKDNEQYSIQGIARDVTERITLEKRNLLIVKILKILNVEADGRYIFPEVLKILKNDLELDAAGIRIHDNVSYPMKYSTGYPGKFFPKNECLSELDKGVTGFLTFDSGVSYNCICGKVLSGNIPSDREYYTSHGSFWTNSVSELIVRDRFLEFIDHPHENLKSGFYQSLAVIPLKTAHKIIGVLHLGIRKPGFFSPDTIEFLEGIADSISLTLDRNASLEHIEKSLAENVRLLKLEKKIISRERRMQNELSEAVSGERQRIGRDIHDGLGQNLTAIGFLVQALSQKDGCNSQENKNDFAIIENLVEKSIIQTKYISRILNPIDIDDEGLIPALNLMTQNISRLFNIDCTFSCTGKQPALSRTVSENLFYITSEAINNSIKHGKSKKIDINLKFSTEGVVLSILDNGTGLSPQKRNTGMGLKTMTHRTKFINGAITMKNMKNGFQVNVTVPSANLKANPTFSPNTQEE